jgi:hypothetical protein
MSLTLDLIKKAAESDKKLAKAMRIDVVTELHKTALLDNPSPNVMTFERARPRQVVRGADQPASTEKYNTGAPQPPVKVKPHETTRGLSTRYSPDHVGVQTRRISDGVYQDPISGRIYDWNEGFTTETGEKYPGGAVSLQSQLYEK